MTARATRDLCVLYGEELLSYSYPDPHPFGRDRLPAFWMEFVRRGLDQKASVESPEPAKEPSLLLFHTRTFIDFVKDASKKGSGFLDLGDTPAFPGVYDAANLVVGSTLKALRLIMSGKYRMAFCPMGGLHHARRDRAGGFCVFNDIGVAIEALRAEYGVKRVAYVDIDAHHGDGVYYGFEADPEVFIGDIHEDGTFLYPGTGSADETGSGSAKGTKLNYPMLPGAGDHDFALAFSRIASFIDQCKPEMIFLQCGSDSLNGDPLAHLQFTTRSHRHAAGELKKLAEKHTGGKLIALGGGGYNLNNLAQRWCSVVEALLER